MSTLLEAVDIVKNFGGLRAVDGCSVAVARQSITGLIGPNGAGKTTFFNLISGFYKPDAGSVTFSGTRIDGLRPHRIVGAGLARTFQIPRELKEMSVLENMMLFAKGQSGERLWNPFFAPGRVSAEEAQVREKAESILEFVQLIHLRDELAKNLSGGQKKLLELARTLMADPEMILLDEPGAGVNPTLMEQLGNNILQLREQGRTFLLIEHDMDVITRLCDRVVVMAKGQVIAEGTFDEIKQNEQVVEAYLAG